MNQIAAPAQINVDKPERNATFTPRSLFARILDSLVSTVIRKEVDDIAQRYEGSSWCDQTEHDLNDDMITGCRTRRRP
jgi:hypothetical protein